MKFRIIGSVVLVIIVILAYALKLKIQENNETGGSSEPTSGYVPQ